jgi:hypothetical protein
MLVFPAAQTAAPATTVPGSTPVAPGTPGPSSPGVPTTPQFTADGRIAGIDGVLDQIAGAVTRQVVPVLQNTVLPILQRDKEMQRTIGEGIGRGAVKALRPILWIIAGSVAVIAYAYWQSTKQKPRDNPLRSTRSLSVKRRRVQA